MKNTSAALAGIISLGVTGLSAAGCRVGDPTVDRHGDNTSNGCIHRALILVDQAPNGAAPLAMALVAAGLDVTTSTIPSAEYAGVPALTGEPPPFSAVLVLSGDPPQTPPSDMPAAGQQALADFVRAGHGLVLTEWAAFHVAGDPTPRWLILKPFVLLGRSGSHTGRTTYTVTPAFASHPLWAGLPSSFDFDSVSNVGLLDPTSGAERVATGPENSDVVALRDDKHGRVVHIAHAGNYVEHGWSNINMQRLVANAVRWAARCDG